MHDMHACKARRQHKESHGSKYSVHVHAATGSAAVVPGRSLLLPGVSEDVQGLMDMAACCCPISTDHNIAVDDNNHNNHGSNHGSNTPAAALSGSHAPSSDMGAETIMEALPQLLARSPSSTPSSTTLWPAPGGHHAHVDGMHADPGAASRTKAHAVAVGTVTVKHEQNMQGTAGAADSDSHQDEPAHHAAANVASTGAVVATDGAAGMPGVGVGGVGVVPDAIGRDDTPLMRTSTWCLTSTAGMSLLAAVACEQG